MHGKKHELEIYLRVALPVSDDHILGRLSKGSHLRKHDVMAVIRNPSHKTAIHVGPGDHFLASRAVGDRNRDPREEACSPTSLALESFLPRQQGARRLPGPPTHRKEAARGQRHTRNGAAQTPRNTFLSAF